MIEKEFYEKWCPTAIPQGEHHELELLTDFTAFYKHPLHIHKNPITGKQFMCWTGHVPTITLARKVFEMWGVGMVYTMIHGLDFALKFTDSQEAFLVFMKEEYGIFLE